MLELLSQLDGFSSNDMIKVIAATNRPDVLDPALLRSGRLDRKIELPHPSEAARAQVMKIHSRKMNISTDVGEDERGPARSEATSWEFDISPLISNKFISLPSLRSPQLSTRSLAPATTLTAPN